MATELGEDIRDRLRAEAESVEAALDALLAGLEDAPPGLREAMAYSLLAGGKRLRPVLVLWCAEACGGEPNRAMPAALAVECVHTFSLIHDDLPALDDDDLRRGRPANHRVFGEATAILAGDALLALAFEVIAREGADPRTTAALAGELARAAGASGMIGGEFLDLEGQARPPDAASVGRIHGAKTARLIQSACRLGAIAAGADNTRMGSISDYGWQLGLAFQTTDDLLDVTGSREEVGKATGKDARAGKQTYPRAVGVEQTRVLARAMADAAVAALAPLGAAAEALAALARYAVERRS